MGRNNKRSARAKTAAPSTTASDSSMVDASALNGSVPASAPSKKRGNKRSLSPTATSPSTAPPPNKKSAENDGRLSVPRGHGRPPLQPIANADQPQESRAAAMGLAAVKEEVMDEESESMANSTQAVVGGLAMVDVKKEPVDDDDEGEQQQQVQQGGRRGRKSNANRRHSTLNDPMISRDASPVGVAGAVDGKLKGHRINAALREQIETEKDNCIIYPFPRYFIFREKKRHGTHRRLDLIQDGEIDGSQPAPDVVYTINSVLAMDKYSVLLDWAGYMYPMWHHKDILKRGSALTEYNLRMRILDFVMTWLLKLESLSGVRKSYPNVTIMQTKDYDEYVKHPGILFLHGLRKRERQIADYIDEYIGKPSDGGPTLIFEDWTNFESSTIPTFEYIRDTKMSKAAAELMKGLVSNPQEGCKCTGARCDREKGCCAFKSKSKMAYLYKNRMGNTAKPNAAMLVGVAENAADCVDLYECGEACACGPACMQRVVQRGLTRHTLVVFKHVDKGWTLWTGNAIKSGAFICEYTGLMLTAKEAASRSDKTYLMDLDVVIRREGKKDRICNMVIDAKDMGNEARFIAHSCQPNLFSFRVHFDVDGRPPRHIGIYASRDIEAGEELTLDYHATELDPEVFHRQCLFTCRCGAAICREKKYQAMVRRNAN